MQNLYREKTPLKDIKNFIDKEHSEINCLRKIDYFDRFDKSEIVVISKKQDGTFRLARPCPICMSAIKDFGIHKIWYTNRENGFSFEKI
jgi:tRNA(Arg) A34 adenosine deaminase TadA